MSGKQYILVPQYMKKFMCIGPGCDDICCVGLDISIDQTTYKKYSKVRDSKCLSKYVVRNRLNTSSMDYARIRFDSDQKCPFLSEERLCKIQLELGEDYLSNICFSYPRVVNIVNGVTEVSATMSCPEAARLALINLDGIGFEEVERPLGMREYFAGRLDTGNGQVAHNAGKYFWDLRIFTIQVLQNRDYDLSDRLIVLGMFCQKANDCISAGRADEIPALINNYAGLLEEGSVRKSLAGVPSNCEIQMELLKELSERRFEHGGRASTLKEFFMQFLSGINYSDGESVKHIAARYKEVYKNYYQPFMSQHEYILENYLVNYVFKSFFPFSGYKSVFNNYIMLVVHYAMIKMYLIGVSSCSINLDLVIKVIKSFAKAVEHSRQYLDDVLELLKNNGYTTMPYMAILIKN